MKKQIIFYSQSLRYEVELSADKTVLVGATEKAQVYLSQQERPNSAQGRWWRGLLSVR